MTGTSSRPGTEDRKIKSLGQCFLEDRNILALEAKLAEPEGLVVAEIGAGDGRLTDAILACNPSRIIAYELDARFAAALRERFKGKPVEVVEGDFLEAEPPEGGFDVVVGNIPYYISSAIVFRLAPIRFRSAVLMVQKEFARKMVARPGDSNYGRLSVTAQLAFSIKLERTVLRHLFRPVPKVDSAIIILKPTGVRLNQFQENVVRYLFQHRNKTVRNALLDSKMFGKEELGRLGEFAKRRVRTLSKEECLVIAGLLEGAT
jgi:16S rRNA (adenine1518-N6/adenine1519-N6)-dimethyltransferase